MFILCMCACGFTKAKSKKKKFFSLSMSSLLLLSWRKLNYKCGILTKLIVFVVIVKEDDDKCMFSLLKDRLSKLFEWTEKEEEKASGWGLCSVASEQKTSFSEFSNKQNMSIRDSFFYLGN